MTENIPQTSASERIEEARAALAESRDASAAVFQATGITPRDTRVERALRALITPPAVGETEEQIAMRVYLTHTLPVIPSGRDLRQYLLAGIREAIQSAHESWEPADVPSQEFMLRHLGIEYDGGIYEGRLWIEDQTIEKEVI